MNFRPGITRDAIAVEWMHSSGQPVRLVDTAGIRRVGQVSYTVSNLVHRLTQTQRDRSNELEGLSAGNAMDAIAYSHVVVLVLDSTDGFVCRQDLALASKAATEGRALIVAINKIDAIPSTKDAFEGIQATLASQLPQVRYFCMFQDII